MGMAPFKEMSDHLDSESEKLRAAVRDALADPGRLPVRDIISVYFQVTNLKSYMVMLRDQLRKAGTGGGDLPARIARMDDFISEKFDGELHPAIVSRLTESVEKTTTAMRSGTGDEAAGYDELREMMSVREFVGQYDR